MQCPTPSRANALGCTDTFCGHPHTKLVPVLPTYVVTRVLDFALERAVLVEQVVVSENPLRVPRSEARPSSGHTDAQAPPPFGSVSGSGPSPLSPSSLALTRFRPGHLPLPPTGDPHAKKRWAAEMVRQRSLTSLTIGRNSGRRLPPSGAPPNSDE
jgi:hypothetical protein